MKYCFLLWVILVSTLLSNAQWSGKVNVFIGDSQTEGYTVPGDSFDPKTMRFTTVLSTMKGSLEDNRGLGGRVLEDGVDRCNNNDVASTALIPTKTSAHLFLYIALGANDIGMNNSTYTPAGFQQKLDQFVSDALNKGWPSQNIVLLTPFWIPKDGFDVFVTYCTDDYPTVARQEAYAGAVKAVATSRNVLLADIYTTVRDLSTRSSLFQSDKLHYNQAGNQFIADFLANLTYKEEALPALLSSFSAHMLGSTVELNWMTESESNTKEFVVERSDNGTNYSAIATVQAAGNSTIQKAYKFEDLRPVPGQNSYRLKCVYKDQKSAYSKIVLVDFRVGFSRSFSPNPAKHSFQLFLQDSTPSLLQIVDLTGKVLRSQNINTQITTIPLDHLGTGVYILKVTNQKENYWGKIMVE